MTQQQEQGGNPFAAVAATRKRKRRKLCLCLTSTAAVIILLVLILLILALTVFKPKRPVTTVNHVALEDLSFSLNFAGGLGLRVNLTLDLDLAIKNPNKVGLKYSDSSASLNYRGQQVGEVPIPAGRISADSITPFNLTLTLMADRLLSNSQLYSDVLSGALPLNTYARIKGKVSILKLFNVHVTSTSSCNFTVFVSNRTVGDQTCNYKTKL